MATTHLLSAVTILFFKYYFSELGRLRVFAALSEDLSSVLSTHVSWLITLCIFSSGI